MNGEIAILLNLLDEAFEKKAWHGPNLRGSLRGLTPGQASWRPEKGRHNIWEIAIHSAYWKYAVRRRLLGEKRGSFRLKGSNWFPRPDPDGSADFRADLQTLNEEHGMLRDAVVHFPVSLLRVIPAGSKVRNNRLIYGIAAHDVYHAGQIQLLKRLM